MCTDLKMKMNTVDNNKVCPLCSKVFAEKSNRDRHVNIVHSQDLSDDTAFDEFDNQHDEQEHNQTMPSMVIFIEMVPSKVSQSLPTKVSTNQQEGKMPHLTKTKSLSIDTKKKQSRLERTLSKIKLQLVYSMNVTKSVLKKLTRDLKENQKEAVKFICDCFDDMLDDDRFIAWLANGVSYKPC